MNKAVSIVVPAFNEQGAIREVMEKMVAEMADAGIPHEIIVVNDGSTDGTAEEISKIANITPINHPVNKGYGASLKTGIRHAQYPLICITDADGTYPNHRIPDLVNRLCEQNLDMVVGARIGDNVSIPLIRRPAKWALRQIANYVAGKHIPDLNSGLRVFRRDVANRFLPILPDKFSFTTTITMGTLTNGYDVEFVPIDYYHRVGNSKIRPIHDTINFVQLVFRIGLYFAPSKIFVPLAIMTFIAGILWGLASLLLFGQLADVSTVVILFSAFQIGAMGLLAEQINLRSPNRFYKDGA